MLSKNIIVLDLETQKSFKEVPRGKLEKLKVSVVGVYDYLSETYITYEEDEIMQLEKRLQNIDLIIGFNIRRFDMPVIAPYFFTPIDQYPVLDLLEDVEKVRGHRASLDSLAIPTLKARKSGEGTHALALFEQNKMDELKKYCLQDVKLTKEIYEYGCREGKVLFTSTWDYKTYEIPVSWKETAETFLQKEATQPSSFPTSLF